MSSMGAASAERLAVGLNSNDFGKDASQAIFWDSHADPVLESRNVGLISACPRWNGRTQHMILSPRIPYRPTAGLAFLFSRSGTSSSAARAVHISSRGVAASTFVEAVRNAMAPVGDTGGRGGSRGQHQSEGAGGFSTGHQQLGGTGGHVAGMGLDADFGRGGSQPVFHPGYGGGGRLLDVGEEAMAILMRGVVEEVVLPEVGSSEVVLCQFSLGVEVFTAGLQMEGLPL